MEKYIKKENSDEAMSAYEPSYAYQRRMSDEGVTRLVSQSELDCECFTLSESKERITERIHQYFHPMI